MKLLKYSAAIVALALFASPAFADCQARLSQIENVIGPAASGGTTPSAQATNTTKGTTDQGATGTVAGGQPSGVDGSTDTQSGAAPGSNTAQTDATGSSKMSATTSSSSGAATTSTGATGAIAGGQASGVDGSSGTQSGAEPSGSSSSKMAAAPSTGSIDMTSARTHLDAARTALNSGNEADCMKAADEAAKAAGLAPQ